MNRSGIRPRTSSGPASAAPHQRCNRKGDHAQDRRRRWQSAQLEGPVLARNGERAEDVGRHSSGEHRGERTHGNRRRRLARNDHARGGNARRGGRVHGVPALRRAGRPAGRVRAAGRRPPAITKLVTIGETVQGQDIVALKVTRRAAQLPDGRRPAVLYVGAQHAREWITPEMVRRLAHHVDRRLRHRPRAHRAGRLDRAVVRPGRQPRRLRPQLHARQPLVAQEPARQQRRRPDHRGRRRRPQPQLPHEVVLRRRRSVGRTGQRDLPRAAPGVRARDPGARPPAAPGRVRVPDQLPLDGVAAALRHRVAGRHADARRRHLRGARGRRRQERRAGLRPGPVCGPRRRQRRHRRARPRRPRDAGVHPRDVVVRRRRARPIRPTSASPPSAARSSTFPDDEAARRRGVRQERPVRARRRAIDPRPRRPGLGPRPSDARVRGRRVRRVLRRTPDRRRRRPPRPAPAAAQLPDRRRPRPPACR